MTTAIVGYAQASTMGQDLDTHLIALSGADVDAGRVFTELPVTKPAKLSVERQGQLRQLLATGELVRELAAAFGIG